MDKNTSITLSPDFSTYRGMAGGDVQERGIEESDDNEG